MSSTAIQPTGTDRRGTTPPGIRRFAATVRLAPTVLAVVALIGFAALGQGFGWRMPKFSALTGTHDEAEADWCEEHSVPESICVECRPDLMPKGKQFGWCRKHGLHECPLCNPGVAQLPGRPQGSAEDRRRADAALAFAPRAENGRTCRQQLRRIQFASDDVFRRLDIGTAPVALGPVTEAITATGELDLDPTRVARLSPRATGTVRGLFKQIGDRVRAGEIVAVVEAADVGRAKAELLQALGDFDLREQTLARLKEAGGRTVTEQAVLDAEAARAEAETRVLAARQALTNLGLPVDPRPLRALAPDAAAGRLRRLGLPDGWPADGAASNNLLPVRSPIDGEVIERPANQGEPADPARVLAVVADTRHMWLTLNVRLEDAGRVRPGQPVRFRHEGHDAGDVGTVAWVSPAADEKTRTVADIRQVEGPSTITREWGQRRITVTCNVRGRDLGSFVAEARRKVGEQVSLPSDRYSIEWSGQFENYERARLRLMIVVPVAVMLIFVLLYFTYHNVVDALRVFTGVPFGWVGGVLALWLRDMPFSISAIVGFIALSGVAVLDDMILVSYVRLLHRRAVPIEAAVEQAALIRLRPVLMTTLVASLGFVPMALSTGQGAEVQRPLATVVIGGVIGAMVMSLLVGRVLYLYFDAAAHSLRWLLTKVFRLPEAGVSSLLGLDVEGKDDPGGAEAGTRPDAAATPATLTPV
jgi:multidrug efflux pump subunit AcrA (membrane-fusion protein)